MLQHAKKLILGTAILCALIPALSHAQSIPLPTSLGGSIFVSHRQAFAVATFDVQNLGRRGKASLDVQTFAGLNGTTGAGVMGTAIALSYNPAANLSLVIGLGVPVPIAGFQVSDITFANLGLELGASYHFSVASVVGTASARVKLHVISTEDNR